MNEKLLTRDRIIRALIDCLEPLEYVHAFYEGGAIAFNRIDEWSDIDAYVVVNDDKIDETFHIIEKALKSLSPIEQKYDVGQTPWSGVYQAFYRLKKASQYLIIDLAVLKLSSLEKFLNPEIHGSVRFHFNKSDKVRPTPLDKNAFAEKLHERLKTLQARFDMFNIFVQKEINRGNILQALELYRAITLASAIEALRIKHNPIHYDFKIQYIHYELPPDILKKLENLYLVKDEEDLQRKYHSASKWFMETMSEIH